MTREGYTMMEVSNKTLAFFNEMRARETRRRKVSKLTQDKYLNFLLLLYQQIEKDAAFLQIVQDVEQESIK